MSDKERLFSEFYSEVKIIEQRDSTLTPKQQIDRLNRPGCTYFNLNPFDVLQVDPEAKMSDIKSRYRQMSLLVHPDKNQDDAERAQKAFDAVTKAYKTLENNESYRKCLEVVQEAKDRVIQMVSEKRIKAKGQTIDEDDPAKYRHAVYVQTCKLFADLERLRVDEETKQQNERKRKAEEEEMHRFRVQYDREWRDNYEESRKDRVRSWRNFTAKKAKKGESLGGFKPPKTRMEQRPN
ncbi:DnaJ subfamily C member protein [Echinococcus granulosus]|uniref:DnaJ subfamily C member protein n=1 Tax=Echinococcus granulosus TaxID=6210 RepID=W6UVF4_ECHGR|nr:DnaJ subfamily C member protein [Echinococcus granulosus]EUB62382.1 DnaJ subfamily C member protein [Echinococcus granulosus]